MNLVPLFHFETTDCRASGHQGVRASGRQGPTWGREKVFLVLCKCKTITREDYRSYSISAARDSLISQLKWYLCVDVQQKPATHKFFRAFYLKLGVIEVAWGYCSVSICNVPLFGPMVHICLPHSNYIVKRYETTNPCVLQSSSDLRVQACCSTSRRSSCKLLTVVLRDAGLRFLILKERLTSGNTRLPVLLLLFSSASRTLM